MDLPISDGVWPQAWVREDPMFALGLSVFFHITPDPPALVILRQMVGPLPGAGGVRGTAPGHVQTMREGREG